MTPPSPPSPPSPLEEAVAAIHGAGRVVMATGAGMSKASGSPLRPDVVWFGEALPERATAEAT